MSLLAQAINEQPNQIIFILIGATIFTLLVNSLFIKLIDSNWLCYFIIFLSTIFIFTSSIAGYLVVFGLLYS